MKRLLWPLAVVVAFGLGLAASSLSRGTNPSSPAGEAPQAAVRRLQMQVSTLEARLRVAENRPRATQSATTGLAATSLSPQLEGDTRQAGAADGSSGPGRSARRGGPPQGEPQDDLAPASRVARPAVAPTAAVTVDGALDRIYRYLDEANSAAGPARWRQRREMIDDLRAMGEAGTEALGRVLAGGTTTDERRTAAQLLGELGDPRALPLLQDVLDKDNDVLLRRAAAAGLRRLAGPETAPFLETLMVNGGEDRFVRMSAAFGLAQLGKPQGVTGLTMIFDESNADGRGRDAAFRALNSLNDERALPFMRQVAASGAEPSYRLQAIRFLTTQGDRQSLAALQQIMQSPSEQPSIRDAATRAYTTIASR